MDKECPECGTENELSAIKCSICNYKFPKQSLSPPPPPPPKETVPKEDFEDKKIEEEDFEEKEFKDEFQENNFQENNFPKSKKKRNIFIIMVVITAVILAIIFILKVFNKKEGNIELENTIEIPQGMVLIPEKDIRIGAVKAVFNDETPTFRIKVDSFFMKETPVTVFDFLAFVEAENYITDAEKDTTIGFWTHETGYQNDKANWRFPRGDSGQNAVLNLQDHPVTQVTWYDAVRYCNWLSREEGFEEQYDTISWSCKYSYGYRLPTEYEWEMAAHGGKMSTYPWGEDFPGIGKEEARANHAGYRTLGEYIQDSEKGDFSSILEHMAKDGYIYTSPVKAFPPNDYGLYDMSGNVWEWCSNYYGIYPPAGSNFNPTGPLEGDIKVMRGGSFGHDIRYLRCCSRGKNYPNMAIELIGFRVMLPVSKQIEE